MSEIVVFLVTIGLAMMPIIELRGAMPIGMSDAIWGGSALSLGASAIASVIGGILACFLVVAIFLPLKKLLARIEIFRKFFDYFDRKANEQLERFSRKNRPKNPQKSAIQKRHAEKILVPTEAKNSTQPRTKIVFPAPQYSRKKSRDFRKNSSQIRRQTNTCSSLQKCVIVFLFCAIPLPFTGVWSAGALCSLLGIGVWASVVTLILANLVGSGVMVLFCLIFNSYIDLVLLIMAIILVFVMLYYLAKTLVFRQKIEKNSTFCN